MEGDGVYTVSGRWAAMKGVHGINGYVFEASDVAAVHSVVDIATHELGTIEEIAARHSKGSWDGFT